MIIYYLHDNPAINAQMLDDKNLSRQIKAVAQVLCNVHLYTASDDLYYGARDDVPLELNTNDKIMEYTEWARTCLANYKQLVDMGLACCAEWTMRNFDWVYNSDGSVSDGSIYRYHNPANRPKHKLQPVIEWCNQNQPDLPYEKHCISCDGSGYAGVSYDPSECLNCYGKGVREIKSTPFPLLMPEEYKLVSVLLTKQTDARKNGVCFVSQKDAKELLKDANATTCVEKDAHTSITESYRNYYRAKINKKTECKECEGTGDGWDCFCCDYGSCNDGKALCCDGKGYKTYNANWSRREKPEFLEEAK